MITNKQYLKPSTALLLPSAIGEDLTVNVSGQLIFLTHVFKSGFTFGFWSHSSWGNVRDQEQGRMLINADLKCADSYETRTWGGLGNEVQSYVAWRSEIKQNHGRAFKLCEEFGDMIWTKDD